MSTARLAALLLALLGLAAPGAAREAVPEERQIMVMLRLAPAHLRVGGDYGGGYGDDGARGGRARIAARLARAHRLRLMNNWPMPMLGVDCFIMTVPDARSTQDAAVRALFAERAELEVRATLKDTAGLPRVVSAKRR